MKVIFDRYIYGDITINVTDYKTAPLASVFSVTYKHVTAKNLSFDKTIDVVSGCLAHDHYDAARERASLMLLASYGKEMIR